MKVEEIVDLKNDKRPDFRLRINKIIASKDHFASEDLGIND